MKELLIRNRIQASIAWLVVIAVMVLIFNLSSQVADTSNELSTGVTEKIVVVIEKVIPSTELDAVTLNHIVRKNAHFFIYCLLGFLVMNAMTRSEITKFYSVLMSFGIGVIYAITDELHQGFVPGRGPGLKDILIDSAGVCFGIFLFILIFRRRD